jgi:hypothetical protein
MNKYKLLLSRESIDTDELRRRKPPPSLQPHASSAPTSAGLFEAVTKPAAAGGQGKRQRSPDRPDVIRFSNSVAVLSGVKEFLRQFRCPKYIRDAL